MLSPSLRPLAAAVFLVLPGLALAQPSPGPAAAGAPAPCPATAPPTTAATPPARGGDSGTAPGGAGSTAWSGGTGGSYVGTAPAGPTPGSPNPQPAVATGLNPVAPGPAEPRNAC